MITLANLANQTVAWRGAAGEAYFNCPGHCHYNLLSVTLKAVFNTLWRRRRRAQRGPGLPFAQHAELTMTLQCSFQTCSAFSPPCWLRAQAINAMGTAGSFSDAFNITQ